VLFQLLLVSADSLSTINRVPNLRKKLPAPTLSNNPRMPMKMVKGVNADGAACSRTKQSSVKNMVSQSLGWPAKEEMFLAC
jgi:hypothetical protein